MLVTGERVTPEQANEIIRRTDTFFTMGYGGNDHKYNAELRTLLQCPHYDNWAQHGAYTPNPYAKREDESWEAFTERGEAWKEKWGVIYTNYVNNNWISHAYIGGPNGWCHPNGRIGFIDNIGKWPDCDMVREEWALIADKFPFLKIGITLMNGDYRTEDIKPILSFVVENGLVRAEEPSDLIHAGHEEARRSKIAHGIRDQEEVWEAHMGHHVGEDSFEHGLPWEWFEAWEKSHFKTIACPQCDGGNEKPFHSCETCHGNKSVRALP